MDEIDAIGGRRFSEGTSADREIQRTLMEVCTFRSWAVNILTRVRITTVAEPDGWFRLAWQDKVNYGDEPTGYT